MVTRDRCDRFVGKLFQTLYWNKKGMENIVLYSLIFVKSCLQPVTHFATCHSLEPTGLDPISVTGLLSCTKSPTKIKYIYIVVKTQFSNSFQKLCHTCHRMPSNAVAPKA